MAEAECFNIGSIVSCKTCFNDELQGEVISYDPLINTILLKTGATSGKASACDVLFINLHYASQVKVIREAPGSALSPLPSLNLSKLNSRVKRSIEEKSKLLQAMQSGGTVEGQRLFLTIGKTIDEVTWSGPNIIVMNQVLISPPYLSENVRDYKDAKESSNSKAVAHVRKIVDKFYKDQQAVSFNNGANISSPNSVSPTNASTNNGSSVNSGAPQVQRITQ